MENTASIANTPPRSELRQLYVTQRQTTREMGRHYGVSKTQIVRWLKHRNIDRRACKPGLAYAGITPPTRAELVHMVHGQFLSYTDIGAKYGVGKTAVAAWIERHDIARPKAWDIRKSGIRPNRPTDEVLRQLYIEDGLSQASIGARADASSTLVRQWLKDAGIEIRPSGFDGGKRFMCADGHLVRSVYEQRVDDWLYERGISHFIEPQLPFDRRSKADFLANGWYIEVWGVVGSKRYERRKEHKQRQYAAYGLALAELKPYDFDAAHDGLYGRKLSIVLQSPVHQFNLFQ